MEQKQENTLDICLLLGKLDGKMDQLIREQTRFESLIAKSQERIDKLEKDSHPPLFSKDQLFKVHSRLETLETKAFVDKVTKYDWQGSD